MGSKAAPPPTATIVLVKALQRFPAQARKCLELRIALVCVFLRASFPWLKGSQQESHHLLGSPNLDEPFSTQTTNMSVFLDIFDGTGLSVF